MIRTGARGYADGAEVRSLGSHSLSRPVCVSGLLGGGVIGLPPVLNFGSPEIQAKVATVFLIKTYD